MTSFRLATVHDREKILDLRRRCFPGEDLEKEDPRFWDWEFLGPPAGKARMFVAEEEGRIAAHFALIPQNYIVGGARTSAVLAVDAMTDPDFRGRGILTGLNAFAVAAAADEFAFGTAYQIRSQVLQPMLRNSWHARLYAPVLMRPLSWRALARRLWSVAATPPLSESGSSATALQMALMAKEFLASSEIYQERTPEYFTWRYLASPVKYDIDVAGDAAYLVTRRTVLKSFSTLAVVDIAWRRGYAHNARTLLRDRLRRGSAAGIEIAAALITTSHPAFSLMLRSGFLPGPHRFRLLLRALRESTERLDRDRWALTWGDTDHL